MKKKKIYNPSDSRKRRYVSSMRNRILAGVVAAVTAATPAVTYAADFGGYGLLNILGTDTGTESVEDNSGTVEVSSVTDVEESVEDVTKLAEDSEKSGDETETKFLFINLSGAEHGKIILNEGEDDERRIKLAKQTTTDDSGNSKEEMMINVYDKDDVLISTESAADNNYIYVCEAEADHAVTAKVVPDDGYLVSKYSLQDKLINGVDENVGFEETDSEFSFPVFMKDNMSLSVGFEEKREDITVDETKQDEAADETAGEEGESDGKTEESVDASTKKSDDLTIGEEQDKEESEEAAEDKADEDLSVKEDVNENNDESSTESVEDVNDDEISDTSGKTEEGTSDANTEDGSDESEEVNRPDMSSEEHFVDTAENVQDLDAGEFTSARLIVLADSQDTIIDPEHIIGNYDNIYLLQYRTPAQAMNAYVYYMEHADAVEPDAKIEAASEAVESSASETTENISDTIQDILDNGEAAETQPAEDIDTTVMTEEEMTADNNAVAALSLDDTSMQAVKSKNVIALIDTGTSEGQNIIDRISLIDNVLAGNTHGDNMARDIISQDPDAQILSIRALGNDGYGSYSAVVSAIEYAINSDVDIINLSMYSKKSLATSILEAEIQKAIDAGIAVVGSAGNDGEEVSSYVPGGIADVYTIGAVNSNGVRRALSNYGDLVDYYVTADSTSDAAALFTGYISANGLENAANDKSGLIFKTASDNNGYDNDEVNVVDKDPETEVKYPTMFDPIIENYVREHADTDYVGDTTTDDLTIMNVLDVKATIADENEISENETIDSLNANGSGFRFLTQQIGRVPVYDFDANSKYFVAFADVMHNDKYAKSLDIQVAQNNNQGIPIDGFIYDKDSGLLYIPKTGFLDEDGVYAIGIVQAQILYSISGFSMANEWNSSAYTVTQDEDASLETEIEGDDIFLQMMNVQVGKHMDVNKMLVCVNGYPVDGHLYSYDADSGNMVLGFSSAVVQSVWVQAEKSENAPDVEPGMKAAASSRVSFKDMGYVDTTPISVFESFFVRGKLWAGASARIGYTNKHNASEFNGKYKNGQGKYITYRAKYAYRGFVNDIRVDLAANGSYGSYYVDYIFNTSKSGDNVGDYIGKKSAANIRRHLTFTEFSSNPYVYNNDKAGREYDCAIQLQSIGQKNDHYSLDFSVFDYHDVLIMECTHVDEPGTWKGWSDPKNIADGVWDDGKVALKLIAFDREAKWAVFALYTDELNTQHGTGLFKVHLSVPNTPTPTPTNTPTPTPSPTPVPPNVQIQKVSTASDEILDLSAYSKQGAEFTIYMDAACTNKLEILKTGTDGLTPVYTLPNKSASYWVKETKAPNGHKINNTPVKVDVSMPAQAGKIIPVKISDDPETTTLSAFAQKLDAKGWPVAGVVFEVKLYDGEYDSVNACPANKLKKTWYLKSNDKGLVEFKDENVAEDYESESFYAWNNQIVIPIGCTVTYQEVQAPSEYKMDQTVQLLKAKNQTIQMEYFYNDIYPCKIKICKLDEDGVTPLQGVKFELTFIKESEAYKDNKFKSYVPLLKEGESVEAETDSNGYIVWENLDQGEYQIVETKTLEGKTLLKDPINITLPITMTDKQAKDMSAATDNGQYDVDKKLWYFYEATYEVTNTPTFVMPITGSNGFWKFGFIGFGAIVVVGTGLVIFDKKGKKQKHRKRVTKK